jgi:ribosomal protein S18
MLSQRKCANQASHYVSTRVYSGTKSISTDVAAKQRAHIQRAIKRARAAKSRVSEHENA